MFQYIKDDRGIVTNYYESIRAFPPEGEYFCSELNVTLVFSTQHTTIRYCDGKTDEIHMNYGGGFVSESGDFYALYRWNQREDQISLTIKRSSYARTHLHPSTILIAATIFPACISAR